MKRGVLYASGTYHSTYTDGYQLSIAHLVIKVVQLHNDSVRKGATMQPITIIQQDPTCSSQYTTCNKNKARHMLAFYGDYIHRGLPCLGLSFSKLGACRPPRTSCSTFFSFEMTPLTTGPTCDINARILIK
jgi:hypothetical protein